MTQKFFEASGRRGDFFEKPVFRWVEWKYVCQISGLYRLSFGQEAWHKKYPNTQIHTYTSEIENILDRLYDSRGFWQGNQRDMPKSTWHDSFVFRLVNMRIIKKREGNRGGMRAKDTNTHGAHEKQIYHQIQKLTMPASRGFESGRHKRMTWFLTDIQLMQRNEFYG